MTALASIETIQEILPHSNAEKLEFVRVKGYKCIVPKDKYRVGDGVVLIQPDTVLPDSQWAEVFKKYAPKRVRAIKIRGEYSLGLVVDPKEIWGTELSFYTEGEDVAELIGVVKYEAPQPKELNAKGPLPYGIFKTDEERFQNIDDLPFGKLVDLSLKRDGQSSTFYCKKIGDTWETGITSRSLELKKECYNQFTQVEKKYKILEKLETFCRAQNKSLALRGEVFGGGIQNHSANPDRNKELSWECFSILDLDTLEYYRKGEEFYFVDLCELIDLPHVPIIERDVELTNDLISCYSENLETISGQLFEGVVINYNNGSFKVISQYYDSRK